MAQSRWIPSTLIITLFVLVSCAPGDLSTSSPTSSGGWSDGGGGGTGSVGSGCQGDADCATPLRCDLQTRTCTPAGSCGAFEIRADAVPSNLLIVLDRSCSMNGKLALFLQSKWAAAVAALQKLLKGQQGKLRFGLTLFPDRSGSKCGQDAIPVPVAPGTEATIAQLLGASLSLGDTNFPSGPCVTNIDTAMKQAGADPSLADPSRQSYVLLITDGKQALCGAGGGDAGTTQTITALRQKKVDTFVVGFGNGVDPNQLDLFAAAGGKPKSGVGRKYYQAEDQSGLEQALASIAARALGCSFTLNKLPGALERIYVFFDGAAIPQDTGHQDGWDFEASSGKVTFYGKACQALSGGSVKDLDFVYGCKQPAAPTCKPGVTVCSGSAGSAGCPAGHGCVGGCCIKVVE